MLFLAGEILLWLAGAFLVGGVVGFFLGRLGEVSRRETILENWSEQLRFVESERDAQRRKAEDCAHRLEESKATEARLQREKRELTTRLSRQEPHS